MTKPLRISSFLLLLTGAAMLFQLQAYAYADPGTGLLAVQAVGSVLVATGWYLRRKLSGLLRWGASAKAASEERPSVEEGEGSTSSEQ
jgi:hypothetical protein